MFSTFIISKKERIVKKIKWARLCMSSWAEENACVLRSRSSAGWALANKQNRGANATKGSCNESWWLTKANVTFRWKVTEIPSEIPVAPCALLSPRSSLGESSTSLRMTYSGFVLLLLLKAGRPPRRPASMPNNSPNRQGLGGPWLLAIAKASVTLASTVYPKTNEFI